MNGDGYRLTDFLVFLFFEAFFSFVNTKEKKAYPLRPIWADTLYPPAGAGGNLREFIDNSFPMGYI